MFKTNISNELKLVIEYMANLVKNELPTLSYTPDYFLLSMIECENCLVNTLLTRNLDNDTFKNVHEIIYQSISRKTLKAIRPNATPKYCKTMENIWKLVNSETLKRLGGKKINTLHILLAFFDYSGEDSLNQIPMLTNLLVKQGLTYQQILNESIELMKEFNNAITPTKIQSKTAEIPQEECGQMLSTLLSPNNKKQKNETSILETLCTNVNKLVVSGKITPIVGREKELTEIINILGRRNKNNVIIVGDGGVGKTTLCEGLAYLIENGLAPTFLSNKQIWQLNLGNLVAGTQFRGVLEGKMVSLINELKNNKKNILFIDDIAVAFADKKNADVDFATLLNSILVDGDTQVIGTCSFKGYRNTFDSNPSLARRFQKLIIDEPSEKDTIDIIEHNKIFYEKHHNVKYTTEAVKTCVLLAKKYLTDRHLPDSAFDILDECGAEKSIMNSDNETTKALRLEIKKISQIINNYKKNDKWDEVEKITTDLYTKIKELKNEEKKIKEKCTNEVNSDDICNLMSRKMGIPITKLTNNERNSIKLIDKTLKKNIIGQDDAIDKICCAIKRNRVGLGGNKTMGNFLLVGKTGVGKSLLAKQLAKEIFGSEKYLVRIDMSEYEDKTAVNKLIGANAGYIGYDNGGILTEAIKNKKYCVLLLDEFEKADPEVYNIFLQVFDEGFLTDNTGQKIDFKNIIVILTSNVGTKNASLFGKGVGFTDNDKSKTILEKEIKNKFSPEFLNRIDNIIYFNNLTDENLKEIIKLELNKVNEKLKKLNNNLSYTDEVVDFILNIILTQKEYGARPILRTIQNEIEDRITNLFLENDYNNHTFSISVENNVLIAK